MTLATADEFGRPWASPVYFAHSDYRELYWVSNPEARHSRNLAERAQLSIVVFDSHLAINTGQAVFMDGEAEQPTGDALDAGIAVFSARSLEHGGTAFTVDDVSKPDGLRLFRAEVSQHWTLSTDPLPGKTGDKRRRVTL
jgi:pyridoxine/pyridoxamine 5'-phosphate oxidase